MKISSGLRRTSAIVFASFAFLYLTYVVAAYAALRGGALTRLTRDVDDFKLEAKGGHSFWPGRVVLEDARLRFKDHNIEVALEARELLIRLSLLPFFSKTVQIDEVEARDARYKMLHRVHDGHRNRERLAAFPDIGFERPKVYDEPSPPYGVPPFRIRVEKIRGNVLEAWILEYRAVGKFEAWGGFELHENVKVFPSRVTLSEGQIYIGEKELAREAQCDLRAEIGPFPGKDPIDQVLGTTDGLIRCDMVVSDLSAFRVYYPDSKVLVDGAGKLKTDIKLTQGKLHASSADAQLKVQRLGLEDAFFAGDVNLSNQFDANGRGLVGAEIRSSEPKESSLDLKRAKIELDVFNQKVLEPSLEGARGEAEGLGARDPAVVRRLAGSGAPLIKLERGNLAFEYRAARGTEKGKMDLDSRGAVALFPQPKRDISCAYRVKVRCALEEKDSSSCAGSQFECAPLTISDGPDTSASIGALLRADAFEFTQERAHSEWGISLGNPKAILRATLAKDVWSNLGLSLLPLGTVEGRARINRRDQTIAGTIDSFQSGLISGQGGFVFAESFVSRWLVNTPVARFGVSQTASGAKVQPFAPSDWDVLDFRP